MDDIQQLFYVFVVFFQKVSFFGCVFACSADACAKTCTPRRLWRSSRFTATRTLHKRVALSYAMERLYILRCKYLTFHCELPAKTAGWDVTRILPYSWVFSVENGCINLRGPKINQPAIQVLA